MARILAIGEKAKRAAYWRKWKADNPERMRAYGRQYDRKNYTAFRVWMDGLKARPCTDCGVQYPSHVMEWDHLPGFTKSYLISTMRHNTRALVLAELAKCELVCAN